MEIEEVKAPARTKWLEQHSIILENLIAGRRQKAYELEDQPWKKALFKYVIRLKYTRNCGVKQAFVSFFVSFTPCQIKKYNLPPSFNLFELVYPLPNEKSEIYPHFLGGPQTSLNFAVI